MNRDLMFATVICLGTAAGLLAEVKPSPQAHARTPATIQAQVTGKITWKGNVALNPGSGDACANFKVSVLEPTPAAPSSGGISIPGSKDLGISAKGLGNIKQGRCSFVIGKGVPEGKPVILAASYDGAMGAGKADKRSGSTAPFTVANGKASQDIVVEFTQIQ
jgi:hypothetical protein